MTDDINLWISLRKKLGINKVTYLYFQHGTCTDSPRFVSGMTYVDPLVTRMHTVDADSPVTHNLNRVRKTLSSLSTPSYIRKRISTNLKMKKIA